MYNLTQKGSAKTQAFIVECQTKRKALLDAGADTAKMAIRTVTEWDIVGDINWRGLNAAGMYDGRFVITDHHSMDLTLNYGEDICGDGPADLFK